MAKLISMQRVTSDHPHIELNKYVISEKTGSICISCFWKWLYCREVIAVNLLTKNCFWNDCAMPFKEYGQIHLSTGKNLRQIYGGTRYYICYCWSYFQGNSYFSRSSKKWILQVPDPYYGRVRHMRKVVANYPTKKLHLSCLTVPKYWG